MRNLLALFLSVLAAAALVIAPKLLHDGSQCGRADCALAVPSGDASRSGALSRASGEGQEESWLTDDLKNALEAFRMHPDETSLRSLIAAIPQSAAENGVVTYMVETDMPFQLRDVCSWIEKVTGKSPAKLSPCAQAGAHYSGEVVNGFRKELRTYSCYDTRNNFRIVSCIWSWDDRSTLSYSFDDQSFLSAGVDAGKLQLFKKEFREAVDAWNAACPFEICKLRIHHPEESFAGGSVLTRFIVKFDDSCLDTRKARCLNKNVYGVSFFRTSTEEHAVRFGSFLMGSDVRQWKRTTRHELGHVLGYGHEQYANDTSVKCPGLTNFGADKPGSGGVAGVNTEVPYDELSIMMSSGCSATLPAELSHRGENSDVARHQNFYSDPDVVN